MKLFLIEYDSGVEPETGETIGAGQACYRTEFAESKEALRIRCGEMIVCDCSDFSREDFAAFKLC